MRTTVELDSSALEAAKQKAERDSISLDKAVSLLVLKGAQGEGALSEAVQSAVFRSPGPAYSSADVAHALEEDE